MGRSNVIKKGKRFELWTAELESFFCFSRRVSKTTQLILHAEDSVLILTCPNQLIPPSSKL